MPEITVQPPNQQAPVAPSPAVVAVFHGINGVDPPSLVAEDEVITATNIDFTLEWGAAAVRRGSERIVQIATSGSNAGAIAAVAFLNESQGAPANADGIIYAYSGNILYRITAGTGTATDVYTVNAISTASGASAGWVASVYRGQAYLQGGDGNTVVTMVKDDGTTVTDWVKQVPGAAPTITVNTLTALAVGTAWTIVEGSGTSASGTASAAADSSTFRVEFDLPVAISLDSNGTHSIGDFGVDAVDIWFSDPGVVFKISRDYGFKEGGTGTADFVNYYHTELDLALFQAAYGDPEVLVESQLNSPPQIVGTSTFTQNIDLATRHQMIQDIRTNLRSPSTLISGAKNVFNSWIVTRPNFQLITRDPNPGNTWATVGTARIVIEGTAVFSAQVRNWNITGARDYSLTDVGVGYSWWETFASFDPINGGITGESGPSPSSPRVKIQGANVIITSTNTATGSHGITHRIFYRQGGYLNDAYAIGTIPFATTTLTDTLTDIDALSLDETMNRNISTVADFGTPPPRAISEPWFDRLFFLASNTLNWSLPGQPDTFPRTSSVVVGDGGDLGISLVVWPPGLIIFCDHSVWEMVGSIFEGPQQDWILQKTGSRHGNKAPLFSCRTPYGVPMIDYDGLYMYTPGQGIDSPMDWVMEKIGDMFKGQATTDPAQWKGNRLPSINMNDLFFSCASYANNKLYIGLSCDTVRFTGNTHLLVIDFRYRRVALYQYPWPFISLVWDQFKNRLYTVTANNPVSMMQIETGITDEDGFGSEQLITWNFKTRSWSTPADILVENLAVHHRGGTAVVEAIYDTTNTTTVGTLTGSTKQWTQPTLGGSFTNNIVFNFSGTQGADEQSAIFNINWDAYVHPKRVTFYRTDYDDNGIEGEKIWDVHYTDMEIIPTSGTGTVLATSFIDGTVVSTFTLTGDLPSSKRRYTFAYPVETYGNKEYTIYQAQGDTVFKLWEHNNGGRPEPPRVVSYVTDRFATREVWQREFMADMNVLGSTNTVTATVFVDELAVGTYLLSTAVGSPEQGRVVFRNAIHGLTTTEESSEIYGEVIYVRYTSDTPFKHYKTWYIQEPQPDRLLFWETTYDTSPSVDVVKTWECELQPLGGVVTGTLFLDGAVVQTATFTGSNRRMFEVGTPNITTGKALKVRYTSATVFKHFRTNLEREPKPFLKKTWNVIYKKMGGVTQLDLARFAELDFESVVPATITSVWYADSRVLNTTILSNTAGQRLYTDRISFPPGCRAYNLQNLIQSDQEFHLWKSNLEIERVGVKGFSRLALVGTPRDEQTVHEIADKNVERGSQ